MPVDEYQKMDVRGVREALGKLHEDVVDGHRRVEISRPDCDDVCVMISKKELLALEQALEILASCSEYKAMHDEITQLAAAAGPECVSVSGADA